MAKHIHWHLASLLIWGIILSIAPNSSAVSLTLQQGTNGYSGCQDSFIVNDGYGTYPNINFGGYTYLYLDSRHWTPD